MGDPTFDSKLEKKLRTFISLEPDELTWLARIQSVKLQVKRGTELAHEGQTGHKAFIIQAGWASSHKDLPNGSRQIISFPIPGDCIGLRSILLRTAAHSFYALTDAVVSPVEGSDILQTVEEYPRIAAAFLWAASRDEAMVVEHLVNVGRRSALERTAHFFMDVSFWVNSLIITGGWAFLQRRR